MTDKDKVVDRLEGREKKSFIIHFGSWIIEAYDRADAIDKAEDMLEDGEYPPIDLITED